MRIAIIHYPKALQSAVYGLEEMFGLAHQLCAEHRSGIHFEVDILSLDQLADESIVDKTYRAIVIPPSLDNRFYMNSSELLKQWLLEKHEEGSILCSACAGAFILADTELLKNREATTHWNLATEFNKRYPDINLNVDKILVNEFDIVTAGGLMSWVDLGLELIAQFSTPAIMRQLGKIMVVDTGEREQRYYQIFSPKFDHGDKEIRNVQRKLTTDYNQHVKVTAMAESCNLTDRTFLRRFVRATGLKPNNYLQRLRVQKACDFLENTQLPFESIAYNVGYDDAGACRKVFVRITGLTPGEFRKRFKSDS